MIKNNSILLNSRTHPTNSKQFMSSKRMFGGSRGKTPKIGAKFRAGMKRTSSIGPSMKAFDEMMSHISGSSSRKKSMFNKRGY